MILYIGDLPNSTRNRVQVIRKFCNLAGHTINLHKSITFLYIKNKHREKEIMDTVSFMTSKKRKNLGMNLMKQRAFAMKTSNL